MYQHGCSRYGYDERVTETSHHSMAIFATKQAHISLPYLCGAKQGSSFVCLTSNVVASLKSQAFFPPPPLNPKLLVQGYTYAFHSRDKWFLAKHLILTIQSYCDDDTRHMAAILLHQVIHQVQWYLDRTWDFYLITKLGRKHNKFAVDILSHPPDLTPPSFSSTAWSYDHIAPLTCAITTNTLTTMHLPDEHGTTTHSSAHHQSTD